MKNIFNEFTPFKNYYSKNDFNSLLKSNNNYFEALSLFDSNLALNYLKSSNPDDIEKFALKLKNQLKENLDKNVKAFQSISTKNELFIDKSNYLSQYSLSELLPANHFDYMKMISVSSGSSGKPFFWPRGKFLELETTIIYELILKGIFHIDKKSTLFIDAYSMGMYVAGTFTLNACLRIALRGYKLSVITPGISSDDVLRIIKEIGCNYDQIIIAGYPPFVKDIIEQGIIEEIDWKKYSLKFIFGAESISEEWREYLYKKAKIIDYYHSSINTYGSADAAILGHETPLTLLIKKIISKKPLLLKKYFNGQSVSTFIQYYPFLKYFEELNGDELIFSAIAGLPLYRYNIHDNGKLFTFNKMVSELKKDGIDIIKEANKLKVSIWKLPFIILFGKSDQTITLYGLNIYPQTIRHALEERELVKSVSTRMTMHTKYTNQMNQYIEIKVELNPNVAMNKELKKTIEKKVLSNLIKHNYEYKTLYEKIGGKAKPRIVLCEYGQIAQNRGTKQKWIQKS